MSENEQASTSNPADNWLKWYLQFVGAVTLLAFAAAVMPESWMIHIAWWLGIDPFPRDPLTFYLARNLAVLYGFVGVGVLVLAANLDRYRDLVGLLAIGTMVFGVAQLIVNAQSGLPWWWTLGEGGSTIFGGVVMRWLYQQSGYSS
jgi:hypothetical protein